MPIAKPFIRLSPASAIIGIFWIIVSAMVVIISIELVTISPDFAVSPFSMLVIISVPTFKNSGICSNMPLIAFPSIFISTVVILLVASDNLSERPSASSSEPTYCFIVSIVDNSISEYFVRLCINCLKGLSIPSNIAIPNPSSTDLNSSKSPLRLSNCSSAILSAVPPAFSNSCVNFASSADPSLIIAVKPELASLPAICARVAAFSASVIPSKPFSISAII